MDFSGWQALAPAEAAAELLRRIGELSSAQRIAAIAAVPSLGELERRFAEGQTGLPLSGVPCFIKDLFDIGGEPTFAGSTFLPEVRPTPARDGAFVAALRAAGLVVAGKAQMVEFAYGGTGENSHFGHCRHPSFPDRTSGGSSSGSAALVGAGVVPFAAGSDTAGSIRVPAAFCGIYGLRLTPRHPWIEDAFPLASQFDTPGWFTATAGDMRTALRALVVRPPAADQASPPPPESRPLEPGASARGCFLELPVLSAEAAPAYRAAAGRLAPAAARPVRDALLECFAGAAGAYEILASLQSSAVHRSWFGRYRDSYDPQVRRRIERAGRWSDAEIHLAQRTVDRTRRVWDSYFSEYDFLILPAVPVPALRDADCTQDSRIRMLACSAPVSLAGLPALSLPVPLDGEPPGLTVGLQIAVREASHPFLDAALAQWSKCGDVTLGTTGSYRGG